MLFNVIENRIAIKDVKKHLQNTYKEECYDISLILLSFNYEELKEGLYNRLCIGINYESDEHIIEMFCDELNKREEIFLN